jgi:hypothetical protein
MWNEDVLRRNEAAVHAASSASARRWAWAAAAWAFLFAALSFAWAIGAMAGAGWGAETTGKVFEELVKERDTSLIVSLWVTGALKAVAGLLALALVQAWGRHVPRRWRLGAAWLAGAGMTLYGLANFVDHGLMLSGVRGIPDGLGETAAWWHLLLWDPFWTLGGVLFIAAAWTAGRTSTP